MTGRYLLFLKRKFWSTNNSVGIVHLKLFMCEDQRWGDLSKFVNM